MGFSNNKWRKILTILMIINLSIILLSKFSKVFAYTFDVPSYNASFNMPEWLDDKKYVLLFNNNTNYFALYWSEQEFKIDYDYNYIRVYGDSINPTYFNPVIHSESQEYFTNWLANSENYNFLTNTSSSVIRNQFGSAYNVSHFCNFDVYNNSNQLVFETTVPTFVYPFFDNSTEIENGNPDGVYISAGDYSNNDNLYFHLLQIDTGLSNSDTSVYYYSDKTFTLNKDSEYYRTWYDPNIEGYYYFIPRYELGLSQNTSYLYVLNNSNNQIQNSYGIYAKDVSNGIYDVVQSDTAGVITSTEEQSDRMKNIEQTLINNQNSVDNIQNTLTDTNVTEDTQTDINSSLQFNNQNEGLTNLNNGFFTRLTTMLSNLLGYNLAQDTSVSIPLPNSNKTLTLHSVDIYNNVTGALRLIINAFWIYIFSFYMWKFINKIYIAISSGTILDTFSSSGEAITNDML